MAKDRSLVRASDIGMWAFCQRAWWLAQVKEVAHQDPARLQRGTEAHTAHGWSVRQAQRLQHIGWVLLAAAALLLLAALVAQWLA